MSCVLYMRGVIFRVNFFVTYEQRFYGNLRTTCGYGLSSLFYVCKNFFRCAWKKYTSFDLQENLAVKKETYDETLEAVLQLPQRYKIVIYLYYYEGYRSNEIARLLNAKESTIRSHLHKGRKLLKEILGRETYEE